MTVHVLDPGPLTTVQSPAGRRRWRHLGVPLGGAVDARSARLANRLVGNADEAPVLEATLSGPTLRFPVAALVAIAGEWEATLDGLPMPAHQARWVRPGATLTVGTGPGARAYVAIGGLTVQSVLGSVATDLRSGFGGHEGRSLRAGDVLAVEPGPRQPMTWRGTRPTPDAIRLCPGPYAGWFSPGALFDGPWQVSDAADRAGVRLDGPSIASREATEVPSMGLPPGAVQIPPDGRPIVMLADGPVTGGYPVPACVITADVGHVAQLRPGDEVRFAPVTRAEAIEALRGAEESLAALEPVSADDDDVGWAGALE